LPKLRPGMKDNIRWDKEYDVVVAGYGGAGISTAITAHDNAASVIILEKAPFPAGGQTLSAGIGAAFAIDPEPAAEYLYRMSSMGLADADPAAVFSVTPREDCLILMRELADNPNWLASLGIEFTIPHRTPREYHEFPGADAFAQLMVKGRGIQFTASMRDQVNKRGIEVLYETPATRLIQDADTRAITGIHAVTDGEEMAIKAGKGVVLCTGGFEFDEEMKANYLRPFPLKFSGWQYNTGDGIRMAQHAGADLWHMNSMVGFLTIWVSDYKVSWLLRHENGIWVNKYGRRYTNEGLPLNHNRWLKHLDYNLDEPGYAALPSYLIFDETIRKKMPVSPCTQDSGLGIQAYPTHLGGCPEGWSRDNLREIEKGWIRKAETIPELGRIIGGRMDPAALEETVKRYNYYCELGHDPEFGRSPRSLEPLVTPPFYACSLYPGGINTLGGPRRNACGQVLDPFKEVIPRLYSAGEMGSICGNVYGIGGLNAGEMMASGRLAGRSVAALNNWG
jgi:hypothetical protein